MGQKVRIDGTEYTVIGIRHNRHRYPIVVRNQAGKLFRVSVIQALYGASRNPIDSCPVDDYDDPNHADDVLD